MIFDCIQHHNSYPFSNHWNEAFKFLKTLTPDSACGRHELQGKDLFVNIDSYETKTRDNAKLETHRKYVDIQYMISGRETHEVFAKNGLIANKPYNPDKDVEFYQIPTETPVTVTLNPGDFVVYLPTDAHMPSLAADGKTEPIKKAVVKIALDLLG